MLRVSADGDIKDPLCATGLRSVEEGCVKFVVEGIFKVSGG